MRTKTKKKRQNSVGCKDGAPNPYRGYPEEAIYEMILWFLNKLDISRKKNKMCGRHLRRESSLVWDLSETGIAES